MASACNLRGFGDPCSALGTLPNWTVDKTIVTAPDTVTFTVDGALTDTCPGTTPLSVKGARLLVNGREVSEATAQNGRAVLVWNVRAGQDGLPAQGMATVAVTVRATLSNDQTVDARPQRADQDRLVVQLP